jgi:stage III sporulation protein SpoIIIAA
MAAAGFIANSTCFPNCGVNLRSTLHGYYCENLGYHSSVSQFVQLIHFLGFRS